MDKQSSKEITLLWFVVPIVISLVVALVGVEPFTHIAVIVILCLLTIFFLIIVNPLVSLLYNKWIEEHCPPKSEEQSQSMQDMNNIPRIISRFLYVLIIIVAFLVFMSYESYRSNLKYENIPPESYIKTENVQPISHLKGEEEIFANITVDKNFIWFTKLKLKYILKNTDKNEIVLDDSITIHLMNVKKKSHKIFSYDFNEPHQTYTLEIYVDNSLIYESPLYSE